MSFSIAIPGLPALLGLLASLLLCAAALITWLPGIAWGFLRRSLRTAPRGVALGGGAVAAAGIVLIGQGLGLRGTVWVGSLLIALLVGLFLGVYLPGLEARQHVARRNRLQLQVIDFCGYMLDALRGPYGDVAVLREYTRRPRRSVHDLQQLITHVLMEQQRSGRGNVLDQLHHAGSVVAMQRHRANLKPSIVPGRVLGGGMLLLGVLGILASLVGPRLLNGAWPALHAAAPILRLLGKTIGAALLIALSIIGLLLVATLIRRSWRRAQQAAYQAAWRQASQEATSAVLEQVRGATRAPQIGRAGGAGGACRRTSRT